MYQFMKPFLDNKMSVYEEYGAFKFIYLSIFVISHQLWSSLLGLTGEKHCCHHVSKPFY